MLSLDISISLSLRYQLIIELELDSLLFYCTEILIICSAALRTGFQIQLKAAIPARLK